MTKFHRFSLFNVPSNLILYFILKICPQFRLSSSFISVTDKALYFQLIFCKSIRAILLKCKSDCTYIFQWLSIFFSDAVQTSHKIYKTAYTASGSCLLLLVHLWPFWLQILDWELLHTLLPLSGITLTILSLFFFVQLNPLCWDLGSRIIF